MSRTFKAFRLAIATAAVALAAACGAYHPYEYVDSKETKPGPGLFTGDDGEWVIYRK